MRSLWRRHLLVTIGISGLLAAAVVPAHAQNVPPVPALTGIHIDNDGFYVVDREPYPLSNSHIATEQELRAPNGECEFKVKLQLPAGATQPIEARRVALNPSTCQARVEYGTSSLANVRAFLGNPPAPAPSTATANSTSTKTGYTEAYWQDTGNFSVVSAEVAQVSWTYDSSQVYSYTPNHAHVMAPDGWGVGYEDYYPSLTSSRAEEDIHAQMHNDIFPTCYGQTVNLWYDYVRFDGYPGGSYETNKSAEVDQYSSGSACQYMLTPGVAIVPQAYTQ